MAAPNDALAVNPQTWNTKRTLLVIFAASGQEEIAAAIVASMGAEMFCCPELCEFRRNYREPARPVRVSAKKATLEDIRRGFEGPVSEETVRLYQRAVELQIKVSSHEWAVIESLFREYSANKSKDERGEQAAREQLDQLLQSTADVKKQAQAAWHAFAEHLNAKRIHSRPFKGQEKFIGKVKSTGIPQDLAIRATSIGMSKKMLGRVRDQILNVSDPVPYPKNFADAAEMLNQIDSSASDMQACMCSTPSGALFPEKMEH